MITRNHAHATIVRTLTEQYEAIGGPPTRSGMAWAIINALTEAGADLGRAEPVESVDLMAALRASVEAAKAKREGRADS